MRRLPAVLVVVALTACSPGVSTPGTAAVQPALLSAEPPPLLPAGLERFDSCDQVLAYFQDHALDQVTPWGLGGRNLELASAAAVTVGAAGSNAYSTTNVQEAGVDEPDLIKTNGDLVVALTNSKLQVLDAAPRLRLLASVDLAEVVPQSLFLADDVVVVIGWAPMPMVGFAAQGMIWQPPDTMLALIDVSNPSNPEITETLQVEGNLLAARLQGDALRMVLSSFPRRLPFVQPDPDTVPAWVTESRALNENRAVIRNSSIEDWFPRYRHEVGGRVREGSLIDCSTVASPERFSGLSATSIITFDLAEGLAPVASFGLASDAQTAYASHDAMYVATQQWHQWNDPMLDVDLMTTTIHRFDTSDAGALTFTGSGEVPGWLYSQWALSEDDEGRLRAASTTAPPWGARPGQTQSVVSVLEQRDDRLEVVGSVGGLGFDEQIYAVRFIGDLGYVVTFRQVDPLYVIDLSDPRSPEVAGAVKIPGYSAYLHPVGDGLLVGVGQDADLGGRVKGTQVALFDVSDPQDPIQIDKITYPNAYSAVEWDHRAFLYWAPTSTLLIPMQGPTMSGAVALTATPEGIVEAAQITQRGYVLRNLVVGDRLLTLSDAAITEVRLGTFQELSVIDLG